MDEFATITKGKGKSLYFTFNGLHADDQVFDKKCPTQVRVAHRLLHALVDFKINLPDFIQSIRQELELLQDGDRVLSYPSVILPVVRGVLEMNDDAPLLLAADELRKLGDEPPIGERSEEAV
eukprot:PhM_4_TR5168/c5_g1_i2/m.79886